jgi:hypothetical protein
VVAVRRWRLTRRFEFSSNKMAHAVDAEIDMPRSAPRPSTIARGISKVLRWLMPEGNSIGPPMRSVARELEEVFPSSDD